MKKKGFTLIELLAVIVILAVVSLIAIPLITNVIESAKKGAIKDSAYGIIESANVYLAKNMKDGIEEIMTFTCSKNKCISGNEEITFKGKVEAGTLILTPSGKSIVCVDDGENYALKLETETKVSGSSGTCGEYEEENGAFTILSDSDALRKEIKEIKEQHQEEIDELQEQIGEKYQEGYDIGYDTGYIAGQSDVDISSLKTQTITSSNGRFVFSQLTQIIGITYFGSNFGGFGADLVYYNSFRMSGNVITINTRDNYGGATVTITAIGK